MTHADVVKSHPLDTDLVVDCQNHDEQRVAQEWLCARGFAHKVTWVIFDNEASTSALVKSAAGPRPVKASIQCSEDTSPGLKALFKGVASQDH